MAHPILLIFFMATSLWKQRNARIFGNQERQYNKDMKMWTIVGLVGGTRGVGVHDPG
jgi:hypothetical protein